MAEDKRYTTLINTLSNDLVNADKIASSLINGYIPEIFGDAFNYGVYRAETYALFDTAFALYNHDTVAYLLTDAQRQILPSINVNIPKDKAWSKSKINSALLQGILQGESNDKIAKRLQGVTDMSRKAAIRNARTLTTSAEAYGRLESFRRSESYGIHINKKWSSTLDSRTRESHVMLDGEIKPIDKEFSNGLMYPGDPNGTADEIYNCRCGLDPSFEELEIESSKTERFNRLYGMSYEEWKYGKMSDSYLDRSYESYKSDLGSYRKGSYEYKYAKEQMERINRAKRERQNNA